MSMLRQRRVKMHRARLAELAKRKGVKVVSLKVEDPAVFEAKEKMKPKPGRPKGAKTKRVDDEVKADANNDDAA